MSVARLGMFGGAFDPPHNAHVALARAAVEQLGLDELRILPTGVAWHKSRDLTPAADRIEMARIAFAGLSRTVIDERETKRPGATYTIDTLRELRAEHPQAALFLVMGEDQALSLTRWREWEAIVAMAVLCVADRPDLAMGDGSPLPVQARVEHLALPSMPESATDVRERLALGQDIGHLVPPGVASYIASHRLYRTHPH